MQLSSVCIVVAVAILASCQADNALIVSEDKSDDALPQPVAASDPSVQGPPPPRFLPTHEWQNVLPGQAIPAGLHIQLDMQTGVKQAKLMPGQNPEDYLPAATSAKQPHLKPALTAEQQRLREIGPALAKLDDGPANSSTMDAERVQQLTEHMAKLWDSMIQDENRLMLELLQAINQLHHDCLVNINMPDLARDQLLELIQHLETLEDLIHQTDNARDLVKMQGFQPLLSLATQPVSGLSTPETKPLVARVHSAALVVLGAAMQNNRPVQSAVLEQAPIVPILNLISQPCDVPARVCQSVVKRGLFCLGALLRHHGNASIQFLNLRGLETTMALWEKLQADPTNKPLLQKLATLMTDMLLLATKPNMTKVDHEMHRLEYLQMKVPLVAGLVVPQNMKRLGLCDLADFALKTYGDLSSLEVFGEVRLLMSGVCDPLPLDVSNAIRQATQRLQLDDEYEEGLLKLLNAVL